MTRFFLSLLFLSVFPLLSFSLFVLTPYALKLEMGSGTLRRRGEGLELSLNWMGATGADAIVTSRQMERKSLGIEGRHRLLIAVGSDGSKNGGACGAFEPKMSGGSGGAVVWSGRGRWRWLA
jgi:hypothetical protein